MEKMDLKAVVMIRHRCFQSLTFEVQKKNTDHIHVNHVNSWLPQSNSAVDEICTSYISSQSTLTTFLAMGPLVCRVSGRLYSDQYQNNR